MLQTLFNYLVQAVLEQRQLPLSSRKVYSILPHLMNKGKWSGASSPIENRPVARAVRLSRNSAATFARVTEHFFSTQKAPFTVSIQRRGFDSTLFRLRQAHEGGHFRGFTSPGLLLLVFREAGQHGGLVMHVNSSDNDAIPDKQKHFGLKVALNLRKGSPHVTHRPCSQWAGRSTPIHPSG